MPKVTFKYDDLDSPEKAEQFIDLFGMSKFNEVKAKFAEKVHGSEKMAKIERLMGDVPNNIKDANDKQSRQLTKAYWEEAEKVGKTSLKKAEVTIEVGSSTRDSLLYENRSKAKAYLGKKYFDAIGENEGDLWINEQSVKRASAVNRQSSAQRKVDKKREEQRKRQAEIDALLGEDSDG